MLDVEADELDDLELHDKLRKEGRVAVFHIELMRLMNLLMT